MSRDDDSTSCCLSFLEAATQQGEDDLARAQAIIELNGALKARVRRADPSPMRLTSDAQRDLSLTSCNNVIDNRGCCALASGNGDGNGSVVSIVRRSC